MLKNGAEIIVETLISHGATEVFGFPGGAVLTLYDELYRHRDQITHYLTSHEQGAAHAADGYARATGKTGVVIATSGPGATNLVTGIATAYLDSTPLIAITGNVTSELMGKDSFQEIDITGITMPITKHNYLVKDIKELEDVLCEAFQIARSGRPGPVLIDIPKDVQAASCEFKGGKPLALLQMQAATEESLHQAAAVINASERPYIYAGGGVISSGTEALLREFAEKVDAPVGLSMMGLTALDFTHPLCLGMTGMHGLPESLRMNAEADLIIGVGVRFSDRATGDTTRYRENARILHIDIDDAEIDKNVDSSLAVLGDLRDVLPRLIELVEKHDRSEWKSHAGEFREVLSTATRAQNELTKEKGVEGWNKDQQGNADVDTDMIAGKGEDEDRNKDVDSNFALTPYRIINAVRSRVDDSMVVATDVGQHQMWVAQYYGFEKPRTLLTSGGLGTMGFGLGAAIGASLAKGSAPTVLFTGDCSFHMNLNELATAVRYQLPLIIVILDNRVLGMVRQWQTLFYGERYSQTTMERPTDYAKLVEAFGGHGYKVTTLAELNRALDEAFAAVTSANERSVVSMDSTTEVSANDEPVPITKYGPIVIDCIINPDASVYPIIPPGGSFDDAIMEN